MDVDLLQQQLIAHMKALQREGYVDEHLQMCYGLKDTTGVKFFVDLIAIFLTDAAAAIDDITGALESPILDYDRVYTPAMKLKEISACIGACRISAGCSALVQAIIMKRSKTDCKRAVEIIKREKSTWEIKLENIMQLEREIVDRQRH